MSQIAISVVQKLLFMREDLDEEEADEMVGWPVVAGHLAEWTDGRRVVGAMELGLDGKMNTVEGAEESHIQLAVDILERALNCNKDERKPLLVLLSKLHIASSPGSKDESVDQDMLRQLHELASEAVESKIGVDATSRNFLSKLEITLTKRLGDVEHVTQVQDAEGEGEATATPEVTEMPAAKPVADDAEAEELEDTMMAGMQAEGTRLPLEEDEEDEDDETSVAAGSGRAITESDIIDSLLESEV